MVLVIPAPAGIQKRPCKNVWISTFAGMTNKSASLLLILKGLPGFPADHNHMRGAELHFFNQFIQV
jgi:hypothetical protein